MSSPRIVDSPTREVGVETTRHPRSRLGFTLALLVVLALFARTVVDAAQFAWNSTLYSHILLVPLVSLYLVWLRRHEQPRHFIRSTGFSLGAAAAGLVVLMSYWIATAKHIAFTQETALTLSITPLVLFIIATVAWFLGKNALRQMAFPLGFLVFAIPLPTSWLAGIETVLQHGSAAVANALLHMTGVPVYYEHLTFELPGISLRVAPECSGIHSSLALLMVSLLAGYSFLRSPWRATLLAGSVLPLALLRNGVRIATVGMLCVYRGPEMINSPIHRKGGPFFFALSLIPFFVLLWVLVRWERKNEIRNAA